MALRTVQVVVEGVLAVQGIVLARLRSADQADFGLTADSKLGGAALEPVLSMPRALRPDGSLRLDLFAFQLQDRRAARRFSVGAEVELSGITDGKS